MSPKYKLNHVFTIWGWNCVQSKEQFICVNVYIGWFIAVLLNLPGLGFFLQASSDLGERNSCHGVLVPLH